ncbi:proteoglycan 4-like [Haliotis rufescens]|uniref:proteoglycan 4-like n=1 Tax=Haliotis rufescens TaxID=6454 RepID=UPI00201E7F5F|nr:proteoglycan 4-like [Haliotis rufescens]
MSLPRELVSILEPLLAYRVGDYSLKTSYKSQSSTLSITFDLGQRKRPLVKPPAKTKPQMARTPAPDPPAPRPAQKKRPTREKKTLPPVLDMEIEASLPTTPPPSAAALELAPLESRGEEPFRSPEGTGHGRKKRKRGEIPSPEPASRPPTTTASTDCQTLPPSLSDSCIQTSPPEPPSLSHGQTQTTPVQVEDKTLRTQLLEEAHNVIRYYKAPNTPNTTHLHRHNRADALIRHLRSPLQADAAAGNRGFRARDLQLPRSLPLLLGLRRQGQQALRRSLRRPPHQEPRQDAQPQG